MLLPQARRGPCRAGAFAAIATRWTWRTCATAATFGSHQVHEGDIVIEWPDEWDLGCFGDWAGDLPVAPYDTHGAALRQ